MMTTSDRPPFAGDRDQPFPSLSPVSDRPPESDGSAVAVGAKKPRDIILEAFGGECNFKWPFPSHKPFGPGFTSHQHALWRVSRKLPPNLSPVECLRFWGLEKNEATSALFYLAENYERNPWLLQGRIIKSTLGRKWVENLYTRDAFQKQAGEELNEGNCDGEFQGVSLRYIPVEDEIVSAIWNDNDGTGEKAFVNGVGSSVEEWLSSRPPPEGHTRFFHGTSAQAMTAILVEGINPSYFKQAGDFGPAFYCVDKVHTSLQFASLSAHTAGFSDYMAGSLVNATEGPHGPGFRAAVMYFDVEDKDLDNLKKVDLDEGDEWLHFTEECLAKRNMMVYKVGTERQNLELVIGKLVHNPDFVEDHGATPVAFEDERKQFAFRKDTAWNLLLANKKKVGVALYDVYLGPSDESDIPNGEEI